MHVVMVSDLETRGGAAIAASRLASALLERSIRVTRIVGEKSGGTYGWDVRSIVPANAFYDTVRRGAPKRWWDSASSIFALIRLRRILAALSPDVINIHNLHAAEHHGWSPSFLSECSRVAPTAWTLHDMWSFTGGCKYAFDCDSYTFECGPSCLACEGHEVLREATIRKNWASRIEVFGKSLAAVAVSPSAWLANEARKGFWRGHRVDVIGNPLPLQTYRPLGRKRARAELGLSQGKPIALVVAHYLSVKRKGMDLLRAALHKLDMSSFHIVLMGRMGSSPAWQGVPVIDLGTVMDDKAKAFVYSAADLTIHPSKAENLSNVIVESLACGTPVVGLPVGGNPELIRQARSGWLSPTISADGLASTIETALSDIAHGIDLSESCRAVAEEVSDTERVAERYVKLFRSMVG